MGHMQDPHDPSLSERLAKHVFLPSELPKDSNTTEEDELKLLSVFNEIFQNYLIGQSHEERFIKSKSTFNLWDDNQVNLDRIHKDIINLNSGESFAVYIREQNCGILFTVMDSKEDKENNLGEFPIEEFVAVSTFPVSLPCSKITESLGSYASVFPHRTVIVPKTHLLNSKALMRQLKDLNFYDMREAVSKAHKGGIEIQEKRDVADPMYVSKWLIGCMADSKSRTATALEIPRVIKKIRDSIVFKNNLPFRRSGLYTAIKVVLQICLQKEIGKTNGYFLYKLILLKFMTSFLKTLKEVRTFNESMVVEMMAKIARRASKLENFLFQNEIKIKSWLQLSWIELVDECEAAMKTVKKEVLEENMKKRIEHGKLRAEVDLRNVKLHIYHSLSKNGFDNLIQTQCDLNQLKRRFIKVGVRMIVPIPPTPKRHRDYETDSLFEPLNFSTDVELGIVLFDFERSISSWDKMLCSQDGVYVWESFRRYLEAAREYYRGDPVGTSRMIVTLLRIIKFWDEIICKSFPIMLQHRCGVDLQFVKDVLVPHKHDLEILTLLEKYFKLRNDNSSYPSLIEETYVSVKSFSARFAANNQIMRQVRDHILHEGKIRAEKKLDEVQFQRAFSEKLTSEIKCLECEYIVDNWKLRHNFTCRKCKLINDERKLKVQVYEQPIPVGIENQYAVIFELFIPTQIAILRDLLFLFSEETIYVDPDKIPLYGPWHSYAQIESCNRRERPWVVSLMSTKKLILDTHYKNLHPSNPDSDFVRTNGYNCCYAGEKRSKNIFALIGEQERSLSYEGIKNRCTFKVVKKSRYTGMQPAVNGSVWTSNDVMSLQSLCHPDLSLTEFIEFGSLRSNWNLQFRNIYRAMTQSSLSLKEESVYNLICQAVWQAGPVDINSFIRKSYSSLGCISFPQEFINMLDNIRQRHSDNWKDHNVLLTVIVLSQRICALRPDCVDSAGELILNCRNDSEKWSSEIGRILSSLTNAPRTEIDSLRTKLIEVNMCCALTFPIDNILLSKVTLNRKESYKTWLLAIANIHDNLVLLGPENKLSTANRNLLRRVDEVGVFIEKEIHETIGMTDLLSSFVLTHHKGSTDWGLETAHWEPYQTDMQVYFCDIGQMNREDSRLQIDIIRGRFLVDGCPVGYLPSSIENHPLFQRVFSNKSFEVQPFGFQAGRVITRDLFPSPGTQGSQYSFYLDDNNRLTVIEHRKNKNDLNETQLELIPHNYFKDNVPALLVHGYTHWFNYRTKEFEFFFRDKNKVSKLYERKPNYILELVNYTLYTNNFDRRHIVDVSCADYVRVLQVVERLEHWKFVNVWKEKGRNFNNTDTFTVSIPRMGLEFSVRDLRVGSMVSNEYRGMKVSSYQESLETLIGLKSGLLLEDADIKSNAPVNSLILVPHGKVIIKKGRIVINVEEIRSPPFFAFEIDKRMKQLKAGESRAGWVYLAYLHAVTSQALPDPFTGVTGTERALQILQSGQIWSSEPLDPETLRTLKEISYLSPSRFYYPSQMKMMETVDWPYSSCISNDAYIIIVKKLIKDSVQLSFLHPDVPLVKVELNETEMELNIRAYWRRAIVSTELARINPKFDPNFASGPLTEPVYPSTFDVNYFSDEMTCVLMISQMSHCQMGFSTPKPPISGLIKDLLLTGADLKGVISEEGFPISDAVYVWSKLDFREYWLDLYNLAKKVKRKDLKAEWTFLLTYLGFRQEDNVQLDHLKFLQTVAANANLFQEINPPDFQTYSMTNEYNLNKEKVLKIIKSNKKPWESYLDNHKEEIQCYESEIDFAERMRPIHQDIVDKQANLIFDKIGESYPVDNCDFVLNSGICSESEWEIDMERSLKQLNILLKNWFKNDLLLNFIKRVESIVAKLCTNVNIQMMYEDKRKNLSNVHSFMKKDLESFCYNPTYLITLREHVKKSNSVIDEDLFKEARKIFDIIPKLEHSRKTDVNTLKENCPDFPLDLKIDCPILKEYMDDLDESWRLIHNKEARLSKIHKNLPYSNPKDKDNQFSILSTELRKKRTQTLEWWGKVKLTIKPVNQSKMNGSERLLIASESFPRIVPLTLLPLITEKPVSRFGEYFKNLIGSFAVHITHEQQAARCVRYGISKNKKILMESELRNELENKGHENWNPKERPEWLLLEIEMDLMVRSIQAKVAERMECPEMNRNDLLQLNMGEGKTFVIVPLLVLQISNGKQLCRVTVLKSLYNMNKDSLISKIGGILLNRRVYSFPCRRDYKIGLDESETILEAYKMCMENRGVVMTLPEHRLSFELKAYERCYAKSFNDAQAIFEVQKFLKQHARDVLDESDEILHVKYQLIYTLGKQMSIGGGSLRWGVVQDLLRVVVCTLPKILAKYGPTFVEFKEREFPFMFPYCRILKLDCSQELCYRVAQRILEGNSKIQIPNITPDKYEIMLSFLTQEQLDRDTLNKVFKMYPSEAHQEILLILRGFLACGVLASSLTKRWRVNFGVNPTGYRRMAVPFRAKDVASERTEFGHPDVAIFLTQLSYYYSGLSEEQLEHVFIILFLESDANSEYKRWIDWVPKDYPGYEKIKSLSGVNLNDFFQKTEVLFPALKHNQGTIDFWLGRVVFPQESKQFGWKIGCSPWDLCQDREITQNPTTGFSGTNDSKILLPKTIAQNDLEELKGTNGDVLRNLLMQDQYEELHLGVTGKSILEKLVDANIRVLLDVGALMLELNNEQVAKMWLKLLDKKGVYVDAAVYFDSNDKLVVMDRSEKEPCQFELSTYRTRLDKCVIYLDDVHTRGTDLKIPNGNVACVTLGKGVTKDKLVQGCMRMRKLGKPDGHKVIFWASQEVHNSIKAMMSDTDKSQKEPTEQMNIKIGTKEVLEWSVRNNQQQIKEGFIHWASAGVYQAQKLSSLKIFNSSKKTENDLVVLAENCSQKEQVDLKQMYGDVRTLQKFPTIVQHLLKKVNRELEKLISKKTNLKVDIEKIVNFFGESVVLHSKKYVEDLMRSTQLLDEEQERELEHELEAEKNPELPAKAKSIEHSISEKVTIFIETGSLHEIESWAVKLPLTLKSSSLWSLYPQDDWGKHIYGSHDYTNVIKSFSSKDKTDDFLRPVNWIVSVKYEAENEKKDRKIVLLLVSPHEADYYFDMFRSGKTIGFLHMFAPRTSTDQDTLFNNAALTLPYNPDRMIELPLSMKSCLLLYSGSSYFMNKTEQDEYCFFTGFCPKPRNEDEEQVFREGGILDGFLVKEFSERLPKFIGVFQENPEKLIRGIVQRRFGSFSMDSHVGKVVIQGVRPLFENNEE